MILTADQIKKLPYNTKLYRVQATICVEVVYYNGFGEINDTDDFYINTRNGSSRFSINIYSTTMEEALDILLNKRRAKCSRLIDLKEKNINKMLADIEMEKDKFINLMNINALPNNEDNVRCIELERDEPKWRL